MPTYGKIKVNTLTYDDSGSAVDLAISNIGVKASPTFTGTITGASLVLSGDLTVNGTTTTIDTTTLQVEDKNIEIGKVSTPSNTTADGGGITLLGGSDGNKTINWVNSTDAWTFSENINIAAGKKLGIGGSNYGTSGHVLTSGGSGSAPTWSALPAAGSTVSLVADGAIGNNASCYVKSNGKVAAISAIAAGANHVASATGGGADNITTTYDREHNKLVTFFRQNHDLKCVVGTPSGSGSTSTFTWGSVQDLHTSHSTYAYMTAEYIWFNNTNKHLVAWIDGTSGTVSLYTMVVDIDASGNATTGAANAVVSSNSNNLHTKKVEVSNGHETPYPYILYYVKSTSDALMSRDGTINTGDNSNSAAGASSALSSANYNDPIYAFKYLDRNTLMAKTTSSQWKYNTRIAGSWKTSENFGGTSISRLTMFYDSTSAKVFAFYLESGTLKWKSAEPTTSGSGLTSWSSETTIRTTVSGWTGSQQIVEYDTKNSKYWLFFSEDSPAQKTFLYGFTISSAAAITWDSSPKEIANGQKTADNLIYETSLQNMVATSGTDNYTSYSESSTMDVENFLGWSSAAYSDGDTSVIKVTGNTVSGLSSLTPGKKYYVQGDGSVALTPASGLSVEAGLALTSTSLLIKG